MDDVKVHKAVNMLAVLIVKVGTDEANELMVCKQFLELDLSPEEMRAAFIVAQKVGRYSKERENRVRATRWPDDESGHTF